MLRRLGSTASLALRLVLLLLLVWPRDAGAVSRGVPALGSSGPTFAPDQEFLIIKRTGVPLGCEPADGGVPPGDAGSPGDAGVGDAGPGNRLDGGPGDAGPGDRLGSRPGDAEPADPRSLGRVLGAGSDGACEPRVGDTVTWVVQPRFSTSSDGSRFAVLIATPGAPLIETAASDTFEVLSRVTAPREIVEEREIEDSSRPCRQPQYGCDIDFSTEDHWNPDSPGGGVAPDASPIGGYVPVTAIGSYQVAVLSANGGDELADWLDGAGYAHDASDIDALRPYLELGWIVTAVRVASQEAVDVAGLEPLSFTFEGDDMRIPLGVARQPDGGRALYKIYVAAEGRYQVPGAKVSYADWTSSGEPAFLTANLRNVDLAALAADDPVPYRATSDSTFRDSYYTVNTVIVPPTCDDDFEICGCRSDGRLGNQLGTLLVAAVCAVLLRRRPRRR